MGGEWRQRRRGEAGGHRTQTHLWGSLWPKVSDHLGVKGGVSWFPADGGLNARKGGAGTDGAMGAAFR